MDETTPEEDEESSTVPPAMESEVENGATPTEQEQERERHRPKVMMSTNRRRSSMEVWEDLREAAKQEASGQVCPHSHRMYGFKATGHTCAICAERDREHLRTYRKLAQDNANIYSWVYLDPLDFDRRWRKGVIFLLLGVSIQVIVPVGISYQLRNDLEEAGYGLCRHTLESKGLGKYLAMILSLYFGVVSIISFLGKVRGNAFLLIFCPPISTQRSSILLAGFLAQFVGALAANIAEYLLFVMRGQDDYLLLLFTSLTMQATLNADSDYLIAAKESEKTNEIIKVVYTDDNLNLGEKGEPLPKDLSVLLHKFRLVYDGTALLLGMFSLFLTVSVTYCI